MANERVELRREMFKPDTLGFEVFPEILEGRKRPVGIFDLPVTRVIRHQTVNQAEDFSKLGITTLADLINTCLRLYSGFIFLF